MNETKEHINFLLKNIEEMSLKEESQRHLLLANACYQYYLYCYKNHLEIDTQFLSKFINCSYIIESCPSLKQIDDEKLKQVVDHLQKINEKDVEDGISLEEVSTLLDWTVSNTRHNFSQSDDIDIFTDSLENCCGFA